MEKTKGKHPIICKKVSETEAVSLVKAFSHGGAYAPAPKSWVGKKVKIEVIK